MATFYTHYKPFSAFSIGGVSKPVSKRTARAIIKKLNLSIDTKHPYRRDIGERKFKNESTREYIYIYAVKK
jgi:hypothetical protein